jgi:hypothetical protein
MISKYLIISYIIERQNSNCTNKLFTYLVLLTPFSSKFVNLQTVDSASLSEAVTCAQNYCSL